MEKIALFLSFFFFFFVLIFWRTSILFCSGCTNLQSHQQRASVPFSPHPCQYSVFLNFLIVTIIKPCHVWNKCLFWSSVFNRVFFFFLFFFFFFVLLLLLPLSSPAAMGVTEAVTVSTISSVFQHVHPRPALFMRYSWHAQLNACNACLWKYLSRDLCLYWMQQGLQFYPGDIDLTMLPKHILPFHAFNLFWSTWRAQESGLPSWALVPFAVIFGLPLGPFLLCRCKTFIWNFMTESQVNILK